MMSEYLCLNNTFMRRLRSPSCVQLKRQMIEMIWMQSVYSQLALTWPLFPSRPMLRNRPACPPRLQVSTKS